MCVGDSSDEISLELVQFTTKFVGIRVVLGSDGS
jgi:hypothetical protein